MFRITAIFLLALLLLGLAGPVGSAPVLENLPYRVSLGPWEQVGEVNLTLRETEPGRYLAEFSGGAKGVWSLLSRWLPDWYRTEMILKNGRLQPLIFREKFQKDGHRVVKEYRFDYQNNRLECWRQSDERPSTREWQVPLKEAVYDPLSLFYNIRMGAFGPLTAGETWRFQTIPTPDPEEIVLSLGPDTGQIRKVMLTVREKSGHERGPYFFQVGPEGVPRTAWIRVLRFGKLSGQLRDPGEIRKGDPFNLSGPGMSSRRD